MPPREKGREGCGGLCGWALELDWLLISLPPAVACSRARGRLRAARLDGRTGGPDSGAVQPSVVCLAFCSFAWLPFCSPFHTVRRVDGFTVFAVLVLEAAVGVV